MTDQDRMRKAEAARLNPPEFEHHRDCPYISDDGGHCDCADREAGAKEAHDDAVYDQMKEEGY